MSRYASTDVARSNREVMSWFFMRISGIVLLFLVLGHVAIMHIFNDVAALNYEFVANRWISPFWVVYDLLMLWLGLLHGVNGLRTIIDDYARHQGWRVMWLTTIYGIAVILLILGTYVAVTFRPVV